MEKEVMGIYVSDHPLRGYEVLLHQSASHSCGSVAEMEEGKAVKLAGVIAAIRTNITKSRGEKMATLTLEDFSGQAGITVFPATYAKFQDHLSKDAVVRVSGVVMHRDRPGNGGDKTIEVRLEDVSPLEPTLELTNGNISDAPGTVLIQVSRATKAEMFMLKNVLQLHRGDFEVQIQILPREENPPIFLPFTVEPSTVFRAAVEKTLSYGKVEVLGRYEEVALASA